MQRLLAIPRLALAVVELLVGRALLGVTVLAGLALAFFGALADAEPQTVYLAQTSVALFLVICAVVVVTSGVTSLYIFVFGLFGDRLAQKRIHRFIGWKLLRSQRQTRDLPSAGRAAWFGVVARALRAKLLLVGAGLAAFGAFAWLQTPSVWNAVADGVSAGFATALEGALLAVGGVSFLVGVAGLAFARPAAAAPVPVLRQRSAVTLPTFISIVGVSIGIWALVVVLGVMHGLQSDLREKILRTDAHLVLEPERPDGSLGDGLALEAAVRALPGIAEAHAFAYGEVMVSSPTGIGVNVVIKGMSDDALATSAQLAGQMVVGGSAWIARPEALIPDRYRYGSGPFDLDLPPDADAPAPAPPHNSLDPAGAPVPPEAALPSAPPSDADRDAPDAGPTAPADGDAHAAAEPDDTLAPAPDDAGTPLPSAATALDADAAPGDAPDAAPGDAPDAPPPGSEGPSAPEATDPPDSFSPSAFGPLPSATALLPGILIGIELSKNLGVDVGMEIQLISPDGDIGPTGLRPKLRSFRVAGIFKTGMYEYDQKLAYVSLDDAQQFFNYGRDLNRLEARLIRAEDAPAALAAARDLIARRFPGLTAADWRERNKNLFSALELERLVMFLILGFIILVAALLIVSSLVMLVVEKVREIAVLKALGASDGSIVRAFMVIGTFIGGFGVLAGLPLGVGTSLFLIAQGFTLPREFYITELPVRLDPVELIIIGLAALGICLLATLYPSLQASRLRPADGLRHG